MMRLSKSRPAIVLFALTASVSLLLNAVPQIAFAGQSTLGDQEGFPGRRVGGGSRGDCSLKAPLIALSPKTNFGKTTVAYPTIYFSVPSADKSLQLKFILKDKTGTTLARREFAIEQASGLVGIDLSKVAQAPLTVNQNYHWYLSAACVAQETGKNWIVDGWIQRVEQSSQTTHLSNNKLLSPESVRQAWKSELWYDAIAALVQLRQPQTTNPKIDSLWKEIFQTEELLPLL